MALSRWAGFGLSACYLLGMAVGARILYDVVNHQFHPGNYLRPGYYFTDGLWGGPLAYLVLASALVIVRGMRWKQSLDVMVLSLPIPMAIAKMACLFNGCCFGTPCDYPWCVVYPYGAAPPAGIARHPTQIYEIAALLMVYIVLVTLARRHSAGLLTLWFLFLYGLARPVAELFRIPGERRALFGLLTVSQAICLAGAFVSLLVLWWVRPPRRAFEPPTIRGAHESDSAHLAFG